MSAVASLRIIPAGLLKELDAASSAGDFYRILGTPEWRPSEFPYSGWVLATLLPVLESAYGIHLMHAHPEITARLSRKCGSTLFVLTQDEQRGVLNRLDPVLFSEEKLQQEYQSFNNETNADGVGEVMLEGIRFLRGGLQQIGPDMVALLTVG